MSKTAILIVEDEPSVSDVIDFGLRKAGLSPVVVSGIRPAKEKLQVEPFGLVIMDLGLPDGDGLALCRWIRMHEREALRALPLIMVTCRDEETDRVLGLELGADDYIVKPFSPRELVARVGSLLRRASSDFSARDSLAQLGPLTLNRLSFTAVVEGKSLGLTKTEFEVLWALLSEKGRVFTRQLLVDRAFDGYQVSERTVDSHIKAIRQKCNLAQPEFNPILTVYGVGYRAASNE